MCSLTHTGIDLNHFGYAQQYRSGTSHDFKKNEIMILSSEQKTDITENIEINLTSWKITFPFGINDDMSSLLLWSRRTKWSSYSLHRWGWTFMYQLIGTKYISLYWHPSLRIKWSLKESSSFKAIHIPFSLKMDVDLSRSYVCNCPFLALLVELFLFRNWLVKCDIGVEGSHRCLPRHWEGTWSPLSISDHIYPLIYKTG